MVRSTLLWLPAVASSTRVTEQVGMMQVNAAAQVFALDSKATAAENMLETVKQLAKKDEKPSEATKNTLQTIQGLLAGLVTSLGQEKDALQSRATASVSAITACDASWTSADSARGNAEQTMNADENAHSGCRTEESADLGDRTSKCNAMNNLFQTMQNNVCSTPSEFDRDNSVTYLSCINSFFTTYSTDNSQKIADCEGAETEYDRQKGECKVKQSTFEEAACAHYTAHAAMCSAYSECRPLAVQDFEAKTAAIGLEETSLKNQYKVLKTVECYVTELLEDDSDATAAALACDQQEFPTATFDITYPVEPAEKPCTVGARPCETSWVTRYSTLPSDAPADTCSACPEYVKVTPVPATQAASCAASCSVDDSCTEVSYTATDHNGASVARGVNKLNDGITHYEHGSTADWLVKPKEGAWATLTLAQPTAIAEMQIWNQNEWKPDWPTQDRDVKDLDISYSDDGTTFTKVTTCTLLNTENADPNPMQCCPVGGITAQYWRITLKTFYSADQYSGLMEVKVISA